MIPLKKLNSEVFYLNPFVIEGMELTPDLVITLVNGKKIVVQDTAEEIIEKITAFYQKINIYLPSLGLRKDSN